MIGNGSVVKLRSNPWRHRVSITPVSVDIATAIWIRKVTAKVRSELRRSNKMPRKPPLLSVEQVKEIAGARLEEVMSRLTAIKLRAWAKGDIARRKAAGEGRRKV